VVYQGPGAEQTELAQGSGEKEEGLELRRSQSEQMSRREGTPCCPTCG